jgi:predicted RNA-binding Zn-ribbon protein involved in translation (DUF1610 family)
MPISVLCPKCRKKLTAPDALAGKRAKCPHCGQVMMLPESAGPAPGPTPGPSGPPAGGQEMPGLSEQLPDMSDPMDTYGVQGPLGGMSGSQFDEMLADVGPKIERPASSSGDDRYPCPACGEMIVRGAAKCRYCGEIFDPVLKKKQRKKQKRRRGGSGFNEDLTATDWVLAILCSGIGCIVGIVYLIQGDPRGGKMIGISILATIIKNVLIAALQSM